MRFSLRFFALFGPLAVACSSSSSNDSVPPAAPAECNADPFSCPAGQTCWVSAKSTQASIHYECLNSQKGAGKGSMCKNVPGAPSCDDGLACFATAQTGTDNGTCVPFCDAKTAGHACGAGEVCQTITYDGTVKNAFQACIGAGAGGSGGTGGGTGGSSAGTGGSSAGTGGSSPGTGGSSAGAGGGSSGTAGNGGTGG